MGAGVGVGAGPGAGASEGAGVGAGAVAGPLLAGSGVSCKKVPLATVYCNLAIARV